ncbi:TetR/AcrR family transcriptional regulator [Dactylosporangium sp. CA-092794]|uniref:TetR/AcrR family transcriptional regulator n=1 Tax=Dactylosporangium sp. CA-092794 TaxID=3239929 RepID=UPI003D935E9D
MAIVDRPARGTRPANRRQLILTAATRLFGARGYEHVSIGDVAEAVAVGPSALYRHFAGKDELLAEVIKDIVDGFTAQIESQTDLARTLSAAASFTLDQRPIGVLWEREARHLPAEAQAAIRERIRHARRRLIHGVHAARPELPAHHADPIGAAVVAVLISPSFHAIDLPRPGYDALLTQLANRALGASLPEPPDPAPAPPAGGLRRSAKRERLLGAAVRLFAERTYPRVSMEDVAVSVGISASSVYNYFPNKATMLVVALDRANGYLQVMLDDTLAGARDPVGALHGLVSYYGRFALAHPHLLDLLITETRNIPREQAAALVQAQQEYVDEWVHLLRQVHPGLDAPRARVTVQAALTVVNDLARTPSIRSRPGVAAELAALCRHVLAI